MDQSDGSTPTLEGVLDQVGMGIVEIEVEAVPEKGGDGAATRLRLVVPLERSGEQNWVSRLLDLPWIEQGDVECHQRARRLLWLLPVAGRASRRYSRRPTLTSVQWTPSLREARRFLGQLRSVGGVVRALKQPSEKSDAELLETALYPEVPVGEFTDAEDYVEFTDMVLDGVEFWREFLYRGDLGRAVHADLTTHKAWKKLLEEIAPSEDHGEAGKPPRPIVRPASRERRQGRGGRAAFEATCSRLGLTPEQWSRSEWDDCLNVAWSALVRRVLADVVAFERRTAGPLSRIGDRARTLLLRLSQSEPLPASGAERTALEGEIDQVLRDAIAALQTCGAPVSEWGADVAGALDRSRTSEDLLTRLLAVHEVARQCIDRGPWVEAMLREADVALVYMIGEAARVLYRRIRSFLTPAERRLFLFFYMPRRAGLGPAATRMFNGWAPWALPFIGPMIEDEELLALTVVVVGLKRRRIGDEDPGTRLRELYRMYVAFYAWWAPIVREEEKERKRQSRRRSREVGFADGEGAELLASPDAAERDGIRDFFRRTFDSLRPQRPRHDIARMYFVDGLTQSEIAQILGKTQQAVSKAIRVFLRKDATMISARMKGDSRGWSEKSWMPRRGRRKKKP